MVDIIAELFQAIGDGLSRYPGGVFLNETLNNGARRLKEGSQNYLSNKNDVKTTLINSLTDFS